MPKIINLLTQGLKIRKFDKALLLFHAEQTKNMVQSCSARCYCYFSKENLYRASGLGSVK